MAADRSRLGLSVTVPRSLDGARALLKARVSGVAVVSGGLALSFELINLAVQAAIEGVAAAGRSALSRGSLAEVGTSAALLALGLFTRAASLGHKAVEAIDGLVALVACVGFTTLLRSMSLESRPELVVLLVSTYVLVARAAVVPSTGRRTFVIGLVALAPLVAATYATYGAGPPALAAAALRKTAYVAEWSAIAVIASSLISWRTHGLTRKVEEARRLGQYTLEEKIGDGGMGEVYRARHAFLRRPTAVKILPPSRMQATSVARFEREVQLTSQLTHPCTIQIYDFGRAEDGTFYYAMEYVDGITLDDLVRRFGAQEPGRVVRILADICASLEEAHAVGLVHRDIKPQNVMLSARGAIHDVVKVLDFGLVKSLVTDGAGDPSRSHAERVTGTPAYMAPEAIARPSEVDARTDLYAVGAVGYFLLAGSPVFTGLSAFELCGHHLHTAPTPPSVASGRAIPGDVEAIVLACLAKSPADRPRSAHDLRARLLATEVAHTGFDEAGAARFWNELRAARVPRPTVAPARRVLVATRELPTPERE